MLEDTPFAVDSRSCEFDVLVVGGASCAADSNFRNCSWRASTLFCRASSLPVVACSLENVCNLSWTAASTFCCRAP